MIQRECDFHSQVLDFSNSDADGFNVRGKMGTESDDNEDRSVHMGTRNGKI